MSEYDSNGFTVEVAEESKPRKSQKSQAEQQKKIEKFAAEFHYEWPVNDDALRAVKDRRFQAAVIRNAIQYARKKSALNAQKYMSECGIPPSVICKDIGMVQDALFHAVNDEVFAMPTDALVKFCYKYLHMSVHEFLFGKPKSTLLPRKLQVVGRNLYMYQEDQTVGNSRLQTLHTLGQGIFAKKMGKNWPLGVENCGQNSDFRYLERITEYAGDQYLNIENIPLPVQTKVALRHMLASNTPISRGLMTSVMRSAIACNMTMDYFLARDYTMLGTVSFVDESGETKEIHDRLALEIVGMLLSMTESAQEEYLAKIIYRTRFEP
ncbi:hypothetical protein [Flavonifractor sp. An306]|uniref:hypothetical protein n=1 Tax=Flavonifractor sp. An306 TaxID=1965629 RepID=UPI0017483A93|nr:hypothetical protein [Flavonifractor sp. An306]